MAYLELSLQQSVEVIGNTGTSYIWTHFKCYFVDIIDEARHIKLTGISNDLKIEVIVTVNHLVRMEDGS